MLQLEMTLAAVPTAPGAARQAVRSWFHQRECGDDASDTAALLVTELVSNAVLHGVGPSLWLTVHETMTDVLRVAVRDGSQVIPKCSSQAPDVNQPGGRGLFMVDSLSTSWGWESLGTGKRVWFELPCAATYPR
jgi:anti-sigma regulatory factor (Ser/Thr protein kinase)